MARPSRPRRTLSACRPSGSLTRSGPPLQVRTLLKRSGLKLFQSANGSQPTRQTGYGEPSKREGQHHLVAARPLNQGANASELWRSSLAFTFVADPLARLRSLYSWWCTNEGGVHAHRAATCSSHHTLPRFRLAGCERCVTRRRQRSRCRDRAVRDPLRGAHGTRGGAVGVPWIVPFGVWLTLWINGSIVPNVHYAPQSALLLNAARESAALGSEPPFAFIGRLAAAHAAADWKVLLNLMHGAGTGAWLKPQDMLGVRENVHTADLPEWSDKETQLACDAVKDAYVCFHIAPSPMCSSAARATKQDSAAAGTTHSGGAAGSVPRGGSGTTAAEVAAWRPDPTIGAVKLDQAAQRQLLMHAQLPAEHPPKLYTKQQLRALLQKGRLLQERCTSATFYFPYLDGLGAVGSRCVAALLQGAALGMKDTRCTSLRSGASLTTLWSATTRAYCHRSSTFSDNIRAIENGAKVDERQEREGMRRPSSCLPLPHVPHLITRRSHQYACRVLQRPRSVLNGGGK